MLVFSSVSFTLAPSIAFADEGDDVIVETGDANSETDVVNEVNTTDTTTNVDTGEESSDAGDASVSEESSESGSSESSTESSTEESLSSETNTETGETSETSTSSSEETSEQTDTTESSSSTEVETEDLTYTEEESSESTDSSSSTTTTSETSTETTGDEGTSQESSSEETTEQTESSQGSSEGSSELEVTAGGEDEPESSASTTIENEADVDIDNEATGDSNTGENAANATGGGAALVGTGDATTNANIVNVLNTNIVNSDGYLLLLKTLFGLSDVDLTDLFGVFSGEDTNDSAGCSLAGCDDAETEYNVSNDGNADVVNDVVLRSTSGSNDAVTEEGTAGIITGNAIANANVVNSVNNNFINSEYLVISLNNVGDMIGDLLLPGANFFDLFFNGGGAAATNTTIDNNSEADVENNVNVGANSGDNTSESENGEAIVATGDAYAGVNIVDQVNQNFINTDNFYMLVQVHGDWTGDVFGLPEGLSWNYANGALQVFTTPGQGTSPSEIIADKLSVANNSVANVKNNIDVYALTGDNYASGGAGSFIGTGDAYATANIFNLVNTNVIGSNFFLGIFNIFGNWNGNLAFGQPDLWLGAQASHGGTHVGPKGGISYTFTIINNGSSRAENLFLRLHSPLGRISFENPERTFDDGSLDTGWSLGSLESGESKTFELYGHVTANLPYGQTQLPLKATVSSNQDDANVLDNTEEIVVNAMNQNSALGGVPVVLQPDSNLVITKTANVSKVVPGEMVQYEIKVTNIDGGPAYHALLVDTITDQHGNVINEEFWDLDRIAPNEEIIVRYGIQFSEDSEPGLYRNHAQVLAVDRHKSLNPFFGQRADTEMVVTEVTLGEYVPPVESVDVFDFADRCNKYLFSYMKLGADNDAGEVMKLQRFLNDHMGTTLQVTGVFDVATEDAVKAFQRKYADEILDPWGIESETGYVYYTTRKKINEIWCNGEEDFSLTTRQLEEIAIFKRRLELLKLRNQPLPETNVVGQREEAFQDLIASDEPDLYVASVIEEETVASASDYADFPATSTPTPLLSSSQVASPAGLVPKGFFKNIFKGVNNALLQVRVQDGDVTFRDKDNTSS